MKITLSHLILLILGILGSGVIFTLYWCKSIFNFETQTPCNFIEAYIFVGIPLGFLATLAFTIFVFSPVILEELDKIVIIDFEKSKKRGNV